MIGKGIVAIAVVIGEQAPQLIDSLLQLLATTLQSLAEYAPELTDSLC